MPRQEHARIGSGRISARAVAHGASTRADGGSSAAASLTAASSRACATDRRSHASNVAGGSIVVINGTQATGTGNGRNGSSRTRSFSVVITTAPRAAARADPTIRRTIRRRVGVMIAERQLARDRPARRRADPKKNSAGCAMPATAHGRRRVERAAAPPNGSADAAAIRSVADRAPVRQADRSGCFGSLVQRDDRVGRGDRVERLAQPAGRQRPRTVEILLGDDHEVGVAVQLKVLKPVVEHVDGAAEMMFGETPREIAVAATPARRRRRAVARASAARRRRDRRRPDADRGSRTTTTPSVGVAPRVAAAENRRALAHGASSRAATSAASGVLARPPTARLPMLMTGRDEATLTLAGGSRRTVGDTVHRPRRSGASR